MTAGIVVGRPRPDQRYRTDGLIGRGGMAEVHRGLDTFLNRPVAIKRLRPDLAANPMLRARFRNEACAAARLNHPSIVGVYDSGSHTDPVTGVRVPFIVMELVEGFSLQDLVRERGRLGSAHALDVTAAVLEALACSHAAGIVHRDIKPANVMVARNGRVKVTDFGIARTLLDGSATLTQVGTVLGTPQYMSPEQVRGSVVDVRSDLYSVGCLLYELLTGRPPFTGESAVTIAYHHVAEDAAPPSALNRAVAPGVDRIVLKALAKDPDERYRSAQEMRADIERTRRLPIESPATVPERRARRASGRPDRRPSSAVRLAMVTAVVLALAAVVGYAADPDDPAAPSNRVPPGSTATSAVPAGPSSVPTPALVGRDVSPAPLRAAPSERSERLTPSRATESARTSPDRAVPRADAHGKPVKGKDHHGKSKKHRPKD